MAIHQKVQKAFQCLTISQQCDFSGSPVAKTLGSQCRRPRFHPCPGNQIPHATAKTQHACSVMSNSLQPRELQPSRFLCPWNFPGKNTGVSCHFLLQGTFLTQGSNPCILCLLHSLRLIGWILYNCITLGYKSFNLIEFQEVRPGRSCRCKSPGQNRRSGGLGETVALPAGSKAEVDLKTAGKCRRWA